MYWTTTTGTRFGFHVRLRIFGYKLTGFLPSGVRYVCITSTLLALFVSWRVVLNFNISFSKIKTIDWLLLIKTKKKKTKIIEERNNIICHYIRELIIICSINIYLFFFSLFFFIELDSADSTTSTTYLFQFFVRNFFTTTLFVVKSIFYKKKKTIPNTLYRTQSLWSVIWQISFSSFEI